MVELDDSDQALSFLRQNIQRGDVVLAEGLARGQAGPDRARPGSAPERCHHGLALAGLTFLLTVIWGGPLITILRRFKIGKQIRIDEPRAAP